MPDFSTTYASPHWLLGRLMPLFRFGCVGMAGLAADLCVFSVLHAHGMPPLGARLFSLAFATLITWRLNRAITFNRSGRHQAGEAMRYVCITGAAQGFSYLVFAALIFFVPNIIPQLALISGAAAAALLSFEGHRLFSFARRKH